MPTFTSSQLAAIGRFVESFCLLYGADDFTITKAQGVRGVPMHDPELNALAAAMTRDASVFEQFRREVAQRINSRLNRNFEVLESHAGFPVMLDMPEGTTVLLIRPARGMSKATTNVLQARERLQETRVFVVSSQGINIHLDMDPEKVFKLPTVG